MAAICETDDHSQADTPRWSGCAPDWKRGMEPRVEATDGDRRQQALTSSIGEVVDLQEVRDAAQKAAAAARASHARGRWFDPSRAHG
jgi:hypothetical protein